jgi:predicted helicase
MRFFVDAYERARKDLNDASANSIKWDAELDRYRTTGVTKQFENDVIRRAAYRPFVSRWLYFDRHFNARHFQLPSMFPTDVENPAITFLCIASDNPLAALATNRVFDLCMLKTGNGGTNMGVSRYRYASDGARLDNITGWALEQFKSHYEKPETQNPSQKPRPHPEEGPRDPSRRMAESARGAVALRDAALGGSSGRGLRTKVLQAGERPITKDAIFQYVYGVLHDPIYREKYAQNLKREFPRIPFYPDFWRWTGWGEALMRLHTGYESVEPWPLARIDARDEKAATGGLAPKPILKPDKEHGIIVLDSETQLSGVPREAWDYRLGNRCALDWILDQYKEKTPRDPTIREKFNTYRFADYKEKVIGLLTRVTRVSVDTQRIVEAMKGAVR